MERLNPLYILGVPPYVGSLIDNEFKILRINDTLCKLIGIDKEKVIGHNCHKVFNHAICHTLKCPIRKIFNGKEHFESEIEIEQENGLHVPCILTAVPLRGSNKEVLGIVENFKDVTEHKRAQEELQKIEKLDSIGLLAGGIAHDLNNLLAAIVGNISLAELYLGSSGNESSIFEVLTGAKKACHQTKELTHQLLTFSKGGAPIKKITTISELLMDTASFALRGSNVKCEFNISEDLWPVEIDRGQISQVINNLIINGKHAMSDGGVINIRAVNTDICANSDLPLDEGKYIKKSPSYHPA